MTITLLKGSLGNQLEQLTTHSQDLKKQSTIATQNAVSQQVTSDAVTIAIRGERLVERDRVGTYTEAKKVSSDTAHEIKKETDEALDAYEGLEPKAV